VLPDIVAILSSKVDGADVRSAVFSSDGDVQLVTSGDTVGPFVVRTISADRVVLVHRATGAAFSVKLD